MRSELDPLRSAPLPDSFERTSDWLRSTPPRRPRRVPTALLVMVLAAVAAWSWPVDVTERTGAVVEAVSSERVEAGHPALQLIGRIVGQERTHLVELEALGREWSGGTVVRYAFSGDSPVRASVWRDSLRAVGGVRSVRLVPIETNQRRPLGVEAARRLLGGGVATRLTDREMQAELDRLFASVTRSTVLPADTVRIIRLTERMTIRLPGSAALHSGSGGPGQMRGAPFVPADSGAHPSITRIFVSIDGKGDPSRTVRLDSLPPETARLLSDHLNAMLRRRDEPSASAPQVLRIRRSGTSGESQHVPTPRRP